MIDDGHKRLIDMMNQFEDAVGKNPVDHQTVREVLLGLVDYTREYFSHEEELQRSIHYPFYASHCRAHREVLRKLATIFAAYAQAQGAERNHIIRGITDFLKEWLVDHIIREDLRMKPYITNPNGRRITRL